MTDLSSQVSCTRTTATSSCSQVPCHRTFKALKSKMLPRDAHWPSFAVPFVTACSVLLWADHCNYLIIFTDNTLGITMDILEIHYALGSGTSPNSLMLLFENKPTSNGPTPDFGLGHHASVPGERHFVGEVPVAQQVKSCGWW